MRGEGDPRLEVLSDDRWSRRANVRGNSAWNVATFIATSGTLLGTVSIAARSLSRQEFGLFSLLTTLTAILPLLDLGLRSPVTVAAARSESAARDYAAARSQFTAGRDTYRVLSLISAAPWSVAAVLVFVIGVDYSGTTSRDLSLTIVTMGAAGSYTIYTASTFALATARGAYRLMGVCSIAGQLINLAIVLMFVHTIGLVALGLGQFVNVLVSRGILALWVRRSTGWLRSGWRLPVRAEATALSRLAGPALLLSVSAQFVAVTDAALLSALAGTAAVAAYRLGSVVPTQSLAVLYRAVDVVLPLMSSTHDRMQQERLAWRASDWGAILAGSGFGVLVILRHDVLFLLTGRVDDQLALLLIMFCAVWACNVPFHAWSLVVLARNDQRLLAPLVILEALANLVISAALIPPLGVVGATLGTLITLSVSNLLLLPIRLRRQFSGLFLASIYRRAVPLLMLSAALPLGAACLPLGLTARVLVSASLLALQPGLFAVSQRRHARPVV